MDYNNYLSLLLNNNNNNNSAINILGGTNIPNSSEGLNGDIYIQYKDYSTRTTIDGYTPLEYLQFVSDAYINLGIIPNNHYLELVCEDFLYSNDKHWFGTSSGAGYFSFTTYNNKYYWGRYGSEANSGSWSPGIHSLQYNGDNNSVTLDEVVLGSGKSISATQNLLIGKRDSSANADSFRLYSCDLYSKNDNQKVLSLIPVKRNIDNTLGLYDTVNHSFYENAGTNSFIGGDTTVGTPIDKVFLKVNNIWIIIEDCDWSDINKGNV